MVDGTPRERDEHAIAHAIAPRRVGRRFKQLGGRLVEIDVRTKPACQPYIGIRPLATVRDTYVSLLVGYSLVDRGVDHLALVVDLMAVSYTHLTLPTICSV